MTQLEAIVDQISKQAVKSVAVRGVCDIKGEIAVQGSKNATNKLIAVTIALPGMYRFTNFPMILDPLRLLRILEYLGGKVEVDESGGVIMVDTTRIVNRAISYELTKTTTSAFGFAGALLGRFGSVQIGKSGGDKIGPRPVDLHIASFRLLGASLVEQGESIAATCPEVVSKDYTMKFASVGAAVNHMLLLVAGHGRAWLHNAPVDSDMMAMYDLLRSQGVKVDVNDSSVYVDARDNAKIDRKICEVRCPVDRNEAFTWLAFGALSRDGLAIHGVDSDDIAIGIDMLRQCGVEITISDSLWVKRPLRVAKHINVVAGLGKEFHSDWAPLLEAVMVVLGIKSRVVDTLFAKRIRQVDMLREMGAQIVAHGGQPPDGVVVRFPGEPEEARYIIDIDPSSSPLHAIDASVGDDVRACAAIILAASQAQGMSNFSDISALYRGYENVIERMCSIGVDITTS